jgi:hypothetical protein
VGKKSDKKSDKKITPTVYAFRLTKKKGKSLLKPIPATNGSEPKPPLNCPSLGNAPRSKNSRSQLLLGEAKTPGLPQSISKSKNPDPTPPKAIEAQT